MKIEYMRDGYDIFGIYRKYYDGVLCKVISRINESLVKIQYITPVYTQDNIPILEDIVEYRHLYKAKRVSVKRARISFSRKPIKITSRGQINHAKKRVNKKKTY